MTDKKAGPRKCGGCFRVPSATHIRVPSKTRSLIWGRSQPPDTGKGGRRDVGLTTKATGLRLWIGGPFPWRMRPGGGQGGASPKDTRPLSPQTLSTCVPTKRGRRAGSRPTLQRRMPERPPYERTACQDTAGGSPRRQERRDGRKESSRTKGQNPGRTRERPRRAPRSQEAAAGETGSPGGAAGHSSSSLCPGPRETVLEGTANVVPGASAQVGGWHCHHPRGR